MAFVRRGCFAIATGLIASIGVAWVSVFIVDAGVGARQIFEGDLLPVVGDRHQVDPCLNLLQLCEAPVALGAGYPSWPLMRIGSGLHSETLFGPCEEYDDPYGYDFAEARGWPLLCVWYGERTSRTPPLVTETDGGVVVGRRSAGKPGVLGSGARVLAYRPLGAGLALNTLIYGVAIFGATEGWTRLVRPRRRPGRCACCGYSLAGLAGGARCPECGGGR